MAIEAKSPQIASQAGHWYLGADCDMGRCGDPLYEIVGRNGNLRPTTLADAKKNPAWRLCPSVTTILGCVEKKGLRRYFDRMIWEATHTTPRLTGEPDDSYFARCLSWADEHSRLAREKGTAIHAAIEQFFDGIDPSPELKPYAMAAFSAVTDVFQNAEWSAEKSFASPLCYGGKVDLHGTADGNNFVCDFKTKSDWSDADLRRGLAYDEHLMQLAAYAHGLGLESPRLLNIFIATDSPGKYHVHEWPAEEHDMAWRTFRALLAYWQLANDYAPNVKADRL